jgi:hypothetical protein
MEIENLMKGKIWIVDQLIGFFWSKKYYVLKQDRFEFCSNEKNYESKKKIQTIHMDEIESIQDENNSKKRIFIQIDIKTK